MSSRNQGSRDNPGNEVVHHSARRFTLYILLVEDSKDKDSFKLFKLSMLDLVVAI